MADLVIRYSFYLLFFLTPLFWTSLNFELFEFNKMLLTYAITAVIVGTWVFKMITQRELVFKRTPLDIPLVLFLASQILSTIFSIDAHTSLTGYYSRLNGGLYSIITYLLLYWAFVSNIQKEHIKNLFKFGLAGGLVVAVYAIMEHFGRSPSCTILKSDWENEKLFFGADCWVQDVQARVFATLGQPNWLAGYLAMLIFPTLYLYLTAKKKIALITYYLILITYYLAFTFTYSRGPTLGLIGGAVVFLLLYFYHISTTSTLGKFIEAIRNSIEIRGIFIILASFIVINLLFGSALTSFRLVSKFAAPPRPNIALPPSTVTQLENGGTESGQIRFIVWQGAWEVFKHYPIFGSGVETFAYSYYQYRPIEHNMTSEWDFLYNKAHNEYLNYLATTGIIGFGTYMGLIIYFVFWCTRFLITSKRTSEQTILLTVLLAAYISYLIYNFFLFSVVIVAIFFFLFPALVFVATGQNKPIAKFPKFLHSTFNILPVGRQVLHSIYRRAFVVNIILGLVVAITIATLFSIFKLWYADTLFNEGQKASDDGNAGKAYNRLTSAVEINPNEPFYLSELGFNAASAAVAYDELKEATISARLMNEADALTDTVLTENPKNVSYYRTAIRTYFELAALDKSFADKTIDVINKTIALAPTDPKLYYNKARILDYLGKKKEAMEAIKKAIELKSNYLDATDQLKIWQTEATKSAQKQ